MHQDPTAGNDKSGGLTLCRQLGEAVLIGDDMRVTVVGISTDKVRIKFDVPRHIAVDREEVRLKADYERRAEQQEIDDHGERALLRDAARGA